MTATKQPHTAEPLTEPAPASSGPVDLDALLTHGGRICGRHVAKSVLYLDDGRRLSFDLPTNADAGDAEKGEELRPWQRDILDVIEEMPVGEVWDNREIVRRAGHLGPSGLASGTQRAFVSALEPRLIRRTKLGWRRV